jgi:O-antigen/teichoic acid export membrane protein
MSTLRRAVVWASVGQYFIIAINFSATLFLARLLTPAEFGVAALGGAIIGVAEAVREVAGGTFLIRDGDLTHNKIRSTTTVNFLVTVMVVTMLVVLAEPLARVFGMSELGSYLRIAVLGYALGTLLYPQQALLSRNMAFNRLALINCAAALAGALVSVILAFAGFKANSFAWGAVASACTGTLIYLAVIRNFSIYKPSLSDWRSVVGFGAYSSATAILGRIAEAVPILIFGKLLTAAELAIGHRAILLCLFPERLLLAAVGAVALPELSRRSREGGDLKSAYLKALSIITAVYWPFMIMLAIFAQPVVELILGHQWLAVVPLVQILAPALMLAVPIVLQFSILVAADSVHILPRLLTLQAVVTGTALLATAEHGLHAAALSMLVAMPINAGLSVITVRRILKFRWGELIGICLRSATVTAAACAGPIMLWLASPDLGPFVVLAIVGVLGSLGWILGLRATNHWLWNEISQVMAASRQLTVFRRERSDRR